MAVYTASGSAHGFDFVAQANSGGPPPPGGTKVKEPMQVLVGVRGTVDWQLVRSCVRRKYGALYGNALGVFDMDLFVLTDLSLFSATRSASSIVRLARHHAL
jgi:hypothetical protein